MEHIRQAVERARSTASPEDVERPDQSGSRVLPPQFGPRAPFSNAAHPQGDKVELSRSHLEANRIISYDIADPRSKSFDMLRTQVLQSMDMKAWQLLAVTSPTASCGKTLTAINLAISIARQPERSVLLVDLDLQKPQVASCLGVKCEHGLLSVLEGRTKLANAMFRACIANQEFSVLPCERTTSNSSEWMVSRPMSAILQEIRRDYRSWIVILDLPPILPSDDVISILPQVDCVLFVAAVGHSTVPEIKECNKHLQSASVVRVVLNKASDAGTAYYYY